MASRARGERRPRRLGWLPWGALAAWALGCQAPAPTGSVRYRAADGSFALTYVTPPWEVVVASDVELQLQIPPRVFGVDLEGSPPTHGLVAGRVDDVRDLDGLLTDAGVGGGGGSGDVGGGFASTGFASAGFASTGFASTGFASTGAATAGTSGGLDDLLPDYLQDVDPTNPRDLAYAELNYLVDVRGAALDAGLEPVTIPGAGEGVEYQVVLDPGVFVRAIYLPTRGAALRVAFISMFDLRTTDVDRMAETIETDAGRSGEG